MNFGDDPPSPEEGRRMMDEILKDPLAHFARLLPKRLKDEGGPFVCLVQMKALPGNLDAMLEIMTAVHQETDENEMEVYAHRIMNGKDGDENSLALVIEYDEPAAFFRHYQGNNIRKFYRSNFLACPPTFSFYRDFDV